MPVALFRPTLVEQDGMGLSAGRASRGGISHSYTSDTLAAGAGPRLALVKAAEEEAPGGRGCMGRGSGGRGA